MINQWICLLPFLFPVLTILVSLIAIAIRRHHGFIFWSTLTGFVFSFLACLLAMMVAPQNMLPLFLVDRFALFFMALFYGAGILITLILKNYFHEKEGEKEELYGMLVIATLGAACLTAARHFISFFLGLETLTVSMYILISFFRKNRFALEAGVKYLILAAVSSSFILFGMALVYAEYGSMELIHIANEFSSGEEPLNGLVFAGFAMILAGAGFKLAVVPFHLWTPDIYQGASPPVAAFTATVSKGGMFVLLLRIFSESDISQNPSLFLLIVALAVLSMLIGNLLALRQNQIKRLLAYSSIAHMGYLLAALLSSDEMGLVSAGFYLTAYFVTILVAFGIVSILTDDKKEVEHVEQFRGLFWKRPWVAGCFTIALLSLAGIPLTGGFIGKFYIMAACVHSALWFLTFMIVLSSAIAIYYYLRVVAVMSSAINIQAPSPTSILSPSGKVSLIVLSVFLLYLGVFPASFIQFMQHMLLS